LPNICIAREKREYKTLDFFTTVEQIAANKSRMRINVNKKTIIDDNKCGDNKCISNNIYHYKTIDTRILRNAPTPEQISGMNITTQDRAVDSIRLLSFLGM